MLAHLSRVCRLAPATSLLVPRVIISLIRVCSATGSTVAYSIRSTAQAKLMRFNALRRPNLIPYLNHHHQPYYKVLLEGSVWIKIDLRQLLRRRQTPLLVEYVWVIVIRKLDFVYRSIHHQKRGLINNQFILCMFTLAAASFLIYYISLLYPFDRRASQWRNWK